MADFDMSGKPKGCDPCSYPECGCAYSQDDDRRAGRRPVAALATPPHNDPRRADAMSSLTEIERRALEHIRRNGDDRNLRAKSWTEIKRSLSRKGYLKRRIGDWAWIVSEG